MLPEFILGEWMEKEYKYEKFTLILQHHFKTHRCDCRKRVWRLKSLSIIKTKLYLQRKQKPWSTRATLLLSGCAYGREICWWCTFTEAMAVSTALSRSRHSDPGQLHVYQRWFPLSFKQQPGRAPYLSWRFRRRSWCLAWKFKYMEKYHYPGKENHNPIKSVSMTW